MNPADHDAPASTMPTHGDLTQRYGASLMGVFGAPGLVLERGEGAVVRDVEGREYLDLLAGIAVNVLGHAHPALVAAVSEQAAKLIHVSNFFTTRPQIELAERLVAASGGDGDTRVFFCNSGAEANEAAFKLARRTARPGVVVAASMAARWARCRSPPSRPTASRSNRWSRASRACPTTTSRRYGQPSTTRWAR